MSWTSHGLERDEFILSNRDDAYLVTFSARLADAVHAEPTACVPAVLIASASGATVNAAVSTACATG